MNDGFLVQLATFLLLFLLPFLGFYIIRHTKKKIKHGYVDGAAKSLGSFVSPHLSYLKEMEGMIVNEVRKTEPKDKEGNENS